MTTLPKETLPPSPQAMLPAYVENWGGVESCCHVFRTTLTTTA